MVIAKCGNGCSEQFFLLLLPLLLALLLLLLYLWLVISNIMGIAFWKSCTLKLVIVLRVGRLSCCVEYVVSWLCVSLRFALS